MASISDLTYVFFLYSIINVHGPIFRSLAGHPALGGPHISCSSGALSALQPVLTSKETQSDPGYRRVANKNSRRIAFDF